jgi:hypothetical protein
MPAPLRNRFTLLFADDLHRGLPGICENRRRVRKLVRLGSMCGLGHVANDGLPSLSNRNILDRDFLLTPSEISFAGF